MNIPRIISLPIAEGKGGLLSFVQQAGQVPFDIKRIYWSYGHESSITRGNHYHPESERVIISIAGEIAISLTDTKQRTKTFTLNQPHHALYIPPNYWIKIELAASSVLLALASCTLKDDDTVRDYAQFEAFGK